MKTQIVIGIGFGDEGKGLVTDYLVSKETVKTLVVRFSGGHQAGHTVSKKRAGKLAYTHVHSQTGSGSLSGADTFYSRYCTFYPLSFVREYNSIANNMSMRPFVFVDPIAPITTVYDVAYNRVKEKINKHGSCGVGFAATVKRHEKCKLYFQDIFFESVFNTKLKLVEDYYRVLCESEEIPYYLMEEEISVGGKEVEYYEAVDIIRAMSVGDSGSVYARSERDAFAGYEKVVFEGSQGVMLDMEWGFFPNVTMSHTTTRNAMEIIARNGLPQPEVFYVTRSYATRHGNGRLHNEDMQPALLREISEETNTFNDWQGGLRRGILDAETLRYAIQCDSHYSNHCSKSLVVTCLDQVSEVRCKNNNVVHNLVEKTRLLDMLGLPHGTPVYGSHSPFSSDVELIYASLFEGVKQKV